MGELDGTGTEARFTYPQCMAMDSNGNMYTSSAGGEYRINKITPEGVVTVIYKHSSCGLAIHPSNNKLYFTVTGPGVVMSLELCDGATAQPLYDFA
jgi:sugar lactone lactonase YvrE